MQMPGLRCRNRKKSYKRSFTRYWSQGAEIVCHSPRNVVTRLARRISFSFTLLFARFSRMPYGNATIRKMPKNCHRDKWCSAAHQMRNPPPNKSTTQWMEWMAIEDQGQVPVRRLYETHQRTVFRPSPYVRLTVGGTSVQSRFGFDARVCGSGSSCTKSTSQSEQWVKPGRYSAPHSGQNI